MNFLAQQLPDTAILRDVLNILIVLAGLAVLIKKLKEEKPKDPEPPKPIPQPLIHQRHPEWVPRHEFTDLKNQVAHVEARVDRVHKDLLEAGEQRAIKIHERLNDLIEPLAEIRGRVNALTDFMKEQRKEEPAKRSR